MLTRTNVCIILIGKGSVANMDNINEVLNMLSVDQKKELIAYLHGLIETQYTQQPFSSIQQTVEKRAE